MLIWMKGYKWIQASVLTNENYWNQRIKAQYLAKMGSMDEAVTVMEKAIGQGANMKTPPFDYDNMKKKLDEWNEAK